MRLRSFPAAVLLALIGPIAGCADSGAGDDAAATTSETGSDSAGPTADGAPDTAAIADAVRAMYANPDAVDTGNPPLPMSEDLAALFAAVGTGANGAPETLDYAWLIGGAQDYELGPVTVTEEPVEPGMTMLRANFTNFGEPQVVRYIFRDQDGQWLLDDIVVDEAGGNATSVADLLRGF